MTTAQHFFKKMLINHNKNTSTGNGNHPSTSKKKNIGSNAVKTTNVDAATHNKNYTYGNRNKNFMYQTESQYRHQKKLSQQKQVEDEFKKLQLEIDNKAPSNSQAYIDSITKRLEEEISLYGIETDDESSGTESYDDSNKEEEEEEEEEGDTTKSHTFSDDSTESEHNSSESSRSGKGDERKNHDHQQRKNVLTAATTTTSITNDTNVDADHAKGNYNKIIPKTSNANDNVVISDHHHSNNNISRSLNGRIQKILFSSSTTSVPSNSNGEISNDNNRNVHGKKKKTSVKWFRGKGTIGMNIGQITNQDSNSSATNGSVLDNTAKSHNNISVPARSSSNHQNQNNFTNYNNNVNYISKTVYPGHSQNGNRPIVITYPATEVVGHGSFGVVFQTWIRETNEHVAIKKVLQDKRFKNRELEIMKQLRHENIVDLKYYYYEEEENTGSNVESNNLYLNLILEYLPQSLYQRIRHFVHLRSTMPHDEVQIYMYQLFKALNYMHGHLGICHRDIKPQNLLVDPSTMTLKLCDFGSAKRLKPNEPNVSYICSRYYRAPELIFGSTHYTTQIDIWSSACVMCELILGQPIFPGESGIDQLVEIIKILGTPNKQEICSMNPNYMEHKFPTIKPIPLIKIFKREKDMSCIELINNMLQYDPMERFNALQCLCSSYFDPIRQNKNEPLIEKLKLLQFNDSTEFDSLTEEQRVVVKAKLCAVSV
ncbi:GSK family serine/threonine-protein kinase SCDLUD_002642 [Saccharomycodes ludwigii]|uniref:GSK family serine/threonine-protein kinase n=1 Tax=Saccharomycodes ludwigii TaxID=36035 RepID=UPI001E82DCFA|nr:hypothetical protein SCDLUD_002642 [Saccharomycodes ludwigii]KAH3901159.1 hypothetical protein SCDLUD_002642 [Saccharomycodes ludwigii]